MSAVADETVGQARPASVAELFFAFNRLALQGFGGVLPVAQRELVERLRWVTRAEFVEILSLGQVLPGPNVVNLALMLGDRFFGLRGAIAALGGMLATPLVIVLALTAAYAELARVAVVAGALRGMGAVAAGLIVATAIKLMSTLRASWAYATVSASTMTSGAASMPPSAASAPRRPKKRSPSMRARLTTFGPGSTWPSERISTNCVFVSQRLRSTSSRCATGSTPPKPCSASRLKAKNSSVADAGRGVSAPASSAPALIARAGARAPPRR